MKFLLGITFMVLMLVFITHIQDRDRKAQCDGKTKIYASIGKAYPCDNYKQGEL